MAHLAGRTVLFGGIAAGSVNGTDDTWEWDGGVAARPGQVLRVSVAAAGLPPGSERLALNAELVAAGVGRADDKDTAGVRLHAWDWRRERWLLLAPDSSGIDAETGEPRLGELVWSTPAAEDVGRWVRPADVGLHLALTPRAPNGDGRAQVVVDYAEVRLRYRVSAGEAAP